MRGHSPVADSLEAGDRLFIFTRFRRASEEFADNQRQSPGGVQMTHQDPDDTAFV
jgi:hypothetical protein